MTTMSWFQSGATPRGTPASRRALPRHPAVLFVVAALALSQTGCQSGMCGPCGSIRNGFRNLSERAFRPFRNLGGGSGGCCGGSTLGSEAPPLQYGPPATVVTPGAVGAPAGTTISPGGATDSLPSALEPIPFATPDKPPAGAIETTPREGSSKSQTGKTNYEAYRPRSGNANRARALARTFNTGPVPTSRSAQGARRSNSTDAESNPLDNLPPLELPKDVANASKGATPARGVEWEKDKDRVPSAAPGDAFDNAPAVPSAAADVTAVPGIRRFAGVESKLAGGSLPSNDGLDWLVEKGYRTVLDLRESVEPNPSFLNEADKRGLRYVALPITLKTVDANHVSRFRSELSLADARPLYFCDTDGTRAGVMWYIHRITVDKVDERTARRDAEEIGLTDEHFVKASQIYIASSKHNTVPGATSPAATPNAPAPALAPTPEAVGKPQAPMPAPTPAPEANPALPPAPEPAPISTVNDAAGSNAPPAPSAGPAPSPLSSVEAVPAPAPHDPTAWRPLAAILVTGLGIPLAYFSRSAFPSSLRALARASLAGPSRLARSLPGGSGD
jgi:protein tyrosine phosphatase (PTP) superfamily phosphohydrolase (DUF442 family)